VNTFLAALERARVVSRVSGGFVPRSSRAGMSCSGRSAALQFGFGVVRGKELVP